MKEQLDLMKEHSLISKKVLIVGLNAVVQRQANGWYGPKPHWKIMELFYESLHSYQFGAIQVYEGNGRSICDYALEDSFKIVVLNEGPYTQIGRVKETPYLYARLLRAVANSDYVYIRLPSWTGLAAWRCARWLNKPYWLSIHGDWSQILSTYEHSERPLLARSYYKFTRIMAERSVKKAIVHARCVFFVGQALCDRLLHSNVPAVVYHDTAHMAAEVWEPRNTCTRERITLLFVGEISKAKGVDVLMQAAERLVARGHKLHLIFAGQGPEADLIQKQRIPGVEIDMKGWVSQGTAFDNLFQEADALVLPSLTEGVPRVIVEAMVRSIPVIATKVGSIPELLGEGTRGWLVNPSDPDSLMRGIEELITDEGKRISRVTEATLYAKTHDKLHWMSVIRSGLEQIGPGLVRSEMS